MNIQICVDMNNGEHNFSKPFLFHQYSRIISLKISETLPGLADRLGRNLEIILRFSTERRKIPLKKCPFSASGRTGFSRFVFFLPVRSGGWAHKENEQFVLIN